jgi:3-oxoacyl-[acyl-carrier protein] reductase
MAIAFDLSGKVALVTGASGALGGGFARALAAHGAKVALAARRFDRLEALKRELAAAGHTAAAIRMDVTDGDSIRAGVAAAAKTLGPIDILVNNAGVMVEKAFFRRDEADWDRVLDTNLKGAWLVAFEVARRLAALGRPGSIVNIASVLGTSRVAARVHEYCASKAGLAQLTKSMAAELARDRIRVNALAPGYVVTDLNRAFLTSAGGAVVKASIPQRRFGEVAELVPAVLLLASDHSAYMTGAVIEIDGGFSAASV